jgi:predicted phage tail protein
MQQTVRLLGDLGERYGSEHVYCNLRSPAEAIKLLCINHPALQKELTEAHQHGVGYTLVQAGAFLGYDDLHLPLGSNDLVLTPVVAGSGGDEGGLNPFVTVLIGAALVATAIATGGTNISFGIGGFKALAAGAATSAAIGNIGVFLVLGGISQMLAPQPEEFKPQNRTRPGENSNATGPQGVTRATSGEQSYAFSGPANTVGVGATVPLVYGKLLIGSHLISSKVSVASESDPTSEFFTAPGPKSVTVNGEKLGHKFVAVNGTRARRYNNSDVRIENKGDLRRKPNQVLLFGSEESIELTDELKDFHADNVRRKNLQYLIEIDNGLSRVIGNQTVPAFVTYELSVKKADYDGEGDPLFTKVHVTVQGLLKKTNTYRLAHAVTVGTSGAEDSNTNVSPRIRIIDTDADEDQRLVVKGVGYRHFFNSSENNTGNLVSES